MRQLRIHEPEWVDLAVFRAGVGAASGTVEFAVPNPDARALVRVDVLYVPEGGDPESFEVLSADRSPLWMALRCYAPARGLHAPIRNLVGTKAAPLDIPVDSGLWGHSVEVQSGEDEIYGRLVATSPGDVGRWAVRAVYNAIDDMTDAEWAALVAKASPRLISPRLDLFATAL